jgi:TRAP-type C4-dicarboxylate transport system substrate-binding protein
MRIARRTFLASSLAAIASPAVIRSACADAPQFTLKLHHFLSSVSSGHDKFLVPWARKIEADSGRRIRVDIFPSMQLGGAPAQLFDQARDGIADIVWAAPSNTPGRFPKTELFELPFVPSRRALVSSRAIEDYAQLNLVDEFREVHPICLSCSDRGVLHTARPIYTIDDIGNLRLHVQTRFTADALHALGAVGVLMPIEQLPLAINQHVIDGGIDPWHAVPALRLNDSLKVHTEFSDVSPSTTTFLLAMNKAVYDRLPRDLKSVIDANSGQAAAGMAGAMWDVQAAIVVDMVSQRGDPITTLLPEAVAHWRKATAPVIEAWIKEMKERKVDGGKLLASAQALLAKYASEPEPQPPAPVGATPSQPPSQASATINPPAALQSAPPVAPAPPVVNHTLAPTPPTAPAPPVVNHSPAPVPKVSVATPAPAAMPMAPVPAPPAIAAPSAPPPVVHAAPPPVVHAAPAPVVHAAPPPVVHAAPPPVVHVVPPPPKTLDIPL